MKKNIIDIEIGFRFTKFRESINLAQHELGTELGVVQGLISKIETGRCYPNLEYLNYLYKKYRLNINWLISGKGEMLIREERQIKKDKKYFGLLKLLQVPVIELQIFVKLEETKIILKDTIENYKNNEFGACHLPFLSNALSYGFYSGNMFRYCRHKQSIEPFGRRGNQKHFKINQIY